MAMKKGLKARWVAALRSGKFKQGKNQLRRKNEVSGKETFCCLGVLCKVSPAVMKRRTLKKFNAGAGSLWGQALAYAGFSIKIETTLARMNDNGGHGFKRIANWIEKNL